MTIRHVVVFRFTDDASDAQVDRLAAGLDALPETVGLMLDYRHGRDMGLLDASWDYVLVAEFATVEDLMTYRDHPAHLALIRDLVEPIVAERVGVQQRLD